MSEVEKLLERQARWQESRRLLSWPEKLRLAAAARETLCQFAKLRAQEQKNRAPEARATKLAQG